MVRVAGFVAAAVAIPLLALGLGLVVGSLMVEGDRRPPARYLITELVAHQRVASEVAELGARELSEPELRRAAWHSALTHRARIAALESLYTWLYGERVGEAMSASPPVLDAAVDSIAEADPIEPTWVDAMIALDEGAVAISEQLIEETSDPVAIELAESIVADATLEVERLRAWRGRYGDD